MAAATKNKKKLENITMKGVRIIFRNFAGKETDYNKKGDRNVCLVLPQDIAEAMRKDGYNIKERPGREEGDEALYYVQAKIKYSGKPPKVVMVTSRGKTTLDEESLSSLDWADVANVDVIVGPYQWTIRPGTQFEASGVSCYVQTMYVTINEDELELMYGDVPDADSGAASGMEWTPNEDGEG